MNLRKDHYRDSVRTRRRSSTMSLRVRFLIAAASNDRDSVASRKDAQYDFVDLCVRGTCPDGLSTISSVGESLLDLIGDGSKNVRRRWYSVAALAGRGGDRLSTRRSRSAAAPTDATTLLCPTVAPYAWWFYDFFQTLLYRRFIA